VSSHLFPAPINVKGNMRNSRRVPFGSTQLKFLLAGPFTGCGDLLHVLKASCSRRWCLLWQPFTWQSLLTRQDLVIWPPRMHENKAGAPSQT